MIHNAGCVIDAEKIREYIRRASGREVRIIFYQETDSTNTRAREYARDGWDGAPTVFIAKRQSAGRGRRGRSFLSAEGGIYVSFLKMAEDVSDSPVTLTARAAVVAAEPIERASAVRAMIKWVNDIYINGKKVAGILAEGEFDEFGKLRHYVVGMGINVYKNSELTTNVPIATTIEDETEYDIDINRIASEIIMGFLWGVKDGVLEGYRERSFIVGQRITVHAPDGAYDADAIAVGEDYSLVVRCDSGEIRHLSSGEVSVRAKATD